MRPHVPPASMNTTQPIRNDLLERVQARLLPALEGPVRIVSESRVDSFGDAHVTLALGTLRVAITRDKRQVLVGFGSVADPVHTFDSHAVFEHLELSSERGSFNLETLDASLDALGRFLRTFRDELADMFSEGHLARTTSALDAIRRARAERLFGGRS